MEKAAEIFFKRWNQFLTNPSFNALEDILDEHVVFYSPVVFSPQKGKSVTSMYLMGASQVLKNGFSYQKKIIQDKQLALEFSCILNEIVVEGVDIITINEFSKITEFKVMLRPFKAILEVKEKMNELLQSFQ